MEQKQEKDLFEKELKDMQVKLEKARLELVGIQEAKKLLKADLITPDQASTYAEMVSQNSLMMSLLGDIWDLVILPDWNNIFYRVGTLLGQIPAETTMAEFADRRKKVYIDVLLKDATQEERDVVYAFFRREKSS